MSARRGKWSNIDVWLLVAGGVGYGAIAITALIAVVVSGVGEHDWRGDFLALGIQKAIWSICFLAGASLLWENRELKRVLRGRGGAR